MTDEEIRLDARIKCAALMEGYAYQFEDKWTGIVGANRAKAGAFDIICAARRLLPIEPAQPSSASEGTT